jgi:hypothetical protein
MGYIMDELASSLGLPCSKEATWTTWGWKKHVELTITRESGAEVKETECKSREEKKNE